MTVGGCNDCGALRAGTIGHGLSALALAALTLFTGLTACPAFAQDRQVLGRGSLLSNDALGDGRDRWRSASVSFSRVTGPGWNGSLPERPLVLREFRLRSEIVTPARLGTPSATDRRYAGIVSVGLHTQFLWGSSEIGVGADLVATGPATGLDQLQSGAHRLVGLPVPSAAVRANQIGNALHPLALGELGLPVTLGQGARLRFFAEAQAGFETYLRSGVDLEIGRFSHDAMMVRDATTGHRYRVVRGPQARQGLALVAGLDQARVFHSALLPPGSGATLEPRRVRARLGVHWQGARAETFAGITRLGPEFREQPTSQTLGSFSVRWRF